MVKYNLTIDELEKWMNNLTINPRTKRKIKIDGPTYKQFQKQLENYTKDKKINENNKKMSEFTQINKLNLDSKLKRIVNKYINANIDILSDKEYKRKFLLYHPDSCKRSINYNGKNVIGIGRYIEDNAPLITDDEIIKCANQLYSLFGKKGFIKNNGSI